MLRVLGKRNQIMQNREDRSASMDSKLKCDEILEHCLIIKSPHFEASLLVLHVTMRRSLSATSTDQPLPILMLPMRALRTMTVPAPLEDDGDELNNLHA